MKKLKLNLDEIEVKSFETSSINGLNQSEDDLDIKVMETTTGATTWTTC